MLRRFMAPLGLTAGRWLVFLVLLTAAGMPAAEPVATAWVRRFNGHADSQDYARAMVSDPFGNVVVAGTTDARFAGGDWFIIKYSSEGVPLWTNRYNGPGNSDDQAHAVAMDVSGNVFVTGESYGGTNTYYDFATVAYSGEGVPLWTNRYDGPEHGYDQPNAVAVDFYSGNVFVTGVSENSESGGADYVTVAYSGAGVPLWTNRYHGPANDYDYPTAMAVDLIGNVFVTGESYGGTNTFYDYATVAYSAWGMPLWTNRYDGTNVVVLDVDGEPDGDDDDYAYAIAVDSGGNVFVTGHSAANYATVAYSGAGVPLWTNRYSGPGGYDGAWAIAVDGSGNVVVTGQSRGAGLNGDDYTTIMYSGAGMPLWTNRYNGPPLPNYSGSDRAVAVAVDGDGNVFVTGQSSGINGNVNSDYLTIKYSSTGVPLWTNRYNGTGGSIDDVQAIAVDVEGNVFVTGSSIGSGGSYDCLTIKYSGAGVPLWTNRYEGGPANSFDQPNAVVVDGNGNVFVTGFSGGDGYGDGDYTTLKYSSAGVPLWTNFYSGPANSFDQATAMAVDGNGNVVVTGTSRNNSNSVSDYVTIKYSGAGVSLWTNHYNGLGTGYDQANAVAVDSYGNVIVTGRSVPGPQGGVNFATIKYSGAGVPLWTNRFAGGGGTDEPKAVAVDAAGNVFVTGYSYPFGGGSSGYATVAYSSTGVPLWMNRYFGLGNFGNNANAIAVDASGNVFVTGFSSTTVNSYDYATIKYSGTGVPLWTNRYDGPGHHVDLANALAVDASGNVVVTGSSLGDGETSYDYATIKYSGAGVPLWTNRYSSPGYDEDSASAVAVDSRGDVFVTGQAAVGDGSFDYATIKYSRAGVPLWTNRYNGPANGTDSPLTKQSLALGPDGSAYVTGRSDANSIEGSPLYDFATIKYVGPVLAIRRSGADVVVSWPSPFSDFTLQQNTNTSGIATPDWSSVTTSVEDDGANRAVTVSPATGTRFYRLAKP